jgi:hypothetical protein
MLARMIGIRPRIEVCVTYDRRRHAGGQGSLAVAGVPNAGQMPVRRPTRFRDGLVGARPMTPTVIATTHAASWGESGHEAGGVGAAATAATNRRLQCLA